MARSIGFSNFSVLLTVYINTVSVGTITRTTLYILYVHSVYMDKNLWIRIFGINTLTIVERAKSTEKFGFSRSKKTGINNSKKEM